MNEEQKTLEAKANEYGGFRNSITKVGLFLLWVAFCLFLLTLNNTFGWWILVVLAIPIYLLAQWIGDKVFATKYGWSTEQVGFSVKRIAAGVLLIVGLGAGTYIILRLFNWITNR